MGSERRLPVSDGEVLAAYRAGESQRALARRFGVSKGAVQKAIARARGGGADSSATPSAPAGSTRAKGRRALSAVDIRERLEHEALHSTDARSRLAALRELRLLSERAGRGESPEQEGFGVPWPPGATSAAIFYYSGAFPTDLDPERAFIVHRGQVGNPERPSLVVFPLPPDARPAAEEPELNPDP